MFSKPKRGRPRKIDDVAAAAELIARRRARTNLADFSTYIDPEEPPALHHRLICDALDKILSGEIRRLMIFCPPGSAKSTYASKKFPAYFVGKVIRKSIICASYGEKLASEFGKHVRNILATPEYQKLFPDVVLSEDSRAKGEWETNTQVSYYAVGVGSGVTGRRADLGLIDDPVKGRAAADSENERNETWQWYVSDFLTRLKPGAAQAIIQCMTGDTLVTMADGSTKYLKDIKIGDSVLTYDKGEISSSIVLNWKNKGSDYLFKIRTSSGIIVRANERHPFLVEREGKLEWVRIRDLIVGESVLRVTGVNGKALNAPLMGVKNQSNAKDTVMRTTAKRCGLRDTGRRQSTLRRTETATSNTDTVLPPRNTTNCLQNKAGDARYAGNSPAKTRGRTGEESYALTTATRQEKFEDFSATTVILQSDMRRPKASCSKHGNTYEIIPDCIVEISPDGVEDVFDIQVEGTENFIANGLISHNTRWHEDDLSGRILPADWNGESGDFIGFDGQTWTVICLAAEAGENDPLGRSPGEFLWPEFMDAAFWAETKAAQTKNDRRNWTALYQQTPQPDSGTFFQREWFKRYRTGEEPKRLSKYGASDYAVSDNAGDFTEHGICGFDEMEDLYLLEGWSGQKTADVWIDEQIKLINRHRPYAWVAEGGLIRRAVQPFMKKRLEQTMTWCRIEWITSNRDKAANARGFQALAASGKVYIPYSEWGDRVLDQLIRFIPNTNFKDDIVDMCGLFGRLIDQTYGPGSVTPQIKKDFDPWGFEDEEPENTWKVL